MKMFKIVAAFLLILGIAGCGDVPQSVTIDKDVPIEVKAGEDVTFTIKVKNADSKEHELRSIDVDQTFLDGIAVYETDPATSEEYEAFGQHIFEFSKPVPANSEMDVVFKAKAVEAGDFSGDLDVCIDGDASCLFNSVRILVK